MKYSNLKQMLSRVRPARQDGQKPGRIRRAEQEALAAMNCILKPQARGLDTLLAVAGQGKVQRKAFDGVLLPKGTTVDFSDARSVRKHRRKIIFIEVKTTSRKNVGKNFQNYYFSISENELDAAEHLGRNYRFALYNRRTGHYLILTLKQLKKRIKRSHISHSVQL